MPYARDDKKLVFLPWDKVGRPCDGLIQSYLNWWWITDPELGILFYQSHFYPQANRNEEVARQVLGNLYPWAEVRQIPLAQVPAHKNNFGA